MTERERRLSFAPDLGGAHREHEHLRSVHAKAVSLKPEGPELVRQYEHHLRSWWVDHVLVLLGWQAVHLLGEAPIDPAALSPIGERRWFMDYLGYTSTSDGDVEPLLVVETKHPRSALPVLAAGMIASNYGELILMGLRGYGFDGPWKSWMATMKGYLERVYFRWRRVPLRVVVTDGDWMVVFRDPQGTFRVGMADAAEDRVTSEDVLVLLSRDEQLRRCGELFDHLDRRALASEVEPTPTPLEELDEVVGTGGSVTLVSRGLQVASSDQPTAGTVGRLPRIEVCPVLFLRLSSGGWVWTWHPRQRPGFFELPHDGSEHGNHVAAVSAASDALLELVRTTLRISVPDPVGVEDLSTPSSRLRLSYPMREFRGGATHHLVVCGGAPHFLRESPRPWSACRYHDATRAVQEGVQIKGVGWQRSLQARSFFKSGEAHFCGHRDVLRRRMLPRDEERPESAMCHLRHFETGLCCRACTLSSTCLAVERFSSGIPCRED